MDREAVAGETVVTGHTAEPWHVSPTGRFIRKANGKDAYSIGHIFADYSNPLGGPADARRIVACVNALAGIPTADLESIAALVEPAARLYELARRARFSAIAAEMSGAV